MDLWMAISSADICAVACEVSTIQTLKQCTKRRGEITEVEFVNAKLPQANRPSGIPVNSSCNDVGEARPYA